jgi:hypothetical protein
MANKNEIIDMQLKHFEEKIKEHQLLPLIYIGGKFDGLLSTPTAAVNACLLIRDPQINERLLIRILENELQKAKDRLYNIKTIKH